MIECQAMFDDIQGLTVRSLHVLDPASVAVVGREDNIGLLAQESYVRIRAVLPDALLDHLGIIARRRSQLRWRVDSRARLHRRQ